MIFSMMITIMRGRGVTDKANKTRNSGVLFQLGITRCCFASPAFPVSSQPISCRTSSGGQRTWANVKHRLILCKYLRVTSLPMI